MITAGQESFFSRAVKKDSSFISATLNLIDVLWELEKKDQVYNVFEKALESNPHDNSLKARFDEVLEHESFESVSKELE